MFDRDFIRHVETLQEGGTPFCAVTVVDGHGSIPQIVGASAIFTAEGLLHGTVGGGTLEATCEQKARELLQQAEPVKNYFRRYQLHKDLGMTCGGEVAVYFEVYKSELQWNIVIFGAGHVAQSLCRFLIELDCHLVCIDTRKEWLDRLPHSRKCEPRLVQDYREGVGTISRGADVLVMTVGHGSDLPILQEIAGRKLDIAHLGVIGSKTKAALVKKDLARQGFPEEFTNKIVCPLGEKIGNNTPPEIAVGIVSQLLRLRQAGRGP